MKPPIFIKPYRKPPPPQTVDAAQFLALQTIVMCLVAESANNFKELGYGNPQDWINHIAAISQDAIVNSKPRATDGSQVDILRRSAMKHVNSILGAINFPSTKLDGN